jgi:AraC-like DNA-binding protein
MTMDHQSANPGNFERVFRFSSEAIPQWKRAAVFREYVRNRIVKLDSCPLGEDNHLDGVAMSLPGLGVVATNLSATRCARTRETMRDGNDNLRLVMLRRAASSAPADHLGRELTVEPGSAIVLSNCDLNAITFTAPRSRLIALNFSRKILRPLLRDFDVVLGHTIPKQIAPLGLLATYIEAFLCEPAQPTPEFAQLAVSHIYDLAALAMGATREAAEIAKNRGLAAARLRDIKSDIAANLSREHLSVVDIALKQRVTPRYVQLLFENEGTTFTEYVRNARLNRAHRMLVDPRLADRSISAIAFDAGFGDLSYFNKAFRRRFGGTPSDVRTAGNGRI